MFDGHQTLLYFFAMDGRCGPYHKQNPGYFVSYGIFLTVYPANGDTLK